jgi:hypothetical protein
VSRVALNRRRPFHAATLRDHRPLFHTVVLALNGPGFTALGNLLGVLGSVLGTLW